MSCVFNIKFEKNCHSINIITKQNFQRVFCVLQLLMYECSASAHTATLFCKTSLFMLLLIRMSIVL